MIIIILGNYRLGDFLSEVVKDLVLGLEGGVEEEVTCSKSSTTINLN
jgi:hypothetical protein